MQGRHDRLVHLVSTFRGDRYTDGCLNRIYSKNVVFSVFVMLLMCLMLRTMLGFVSTWKTDFKECFICIYSKIKCQIIRSQY